MQLGCDPHSSCILWTDPHTKVAPIPWPGPGVDISPHAALPRPHPTTGLPPPLSQPPHYLQPPLHCITLSHTALYTHTSTLSPKLARLLLFVPCSLPLLLPLPRPTKCNALSELVKPTLLSAQFTQTNTVEMLATYAITNFDN